MEWLFLPSDFGIINFSTYLLGTIFIILLPGPNSLYVLTISTQKGWRAGAWASIGIFIGDAILMTGVAFGAASLLDSSSVAFQVFRMLGAIYLGWLGYTLIQGGLRRWSATEEIVNARVAQGYLDYLHPALAALALSLTNPKAIFFFASFFTQFIQPGYAQPVFTFLYLAVVLQFVSMTYLLVLIVAGQFFLDRFEKHPRYAAFLWIGIGLLILGFTTSLFI
jgi:leucine efflux protein